MRKEVWDQLRSITAGELKHALDRDAVSGWYADESGGSAKVYRNDRTGKIVSIHVHAHKTYGAKQLRQLLDGIGWTENDLKRLKLIK